MDTNKSLGERDKQYNWHAYTQHLTADLAIPIVKGKDALLWDADGKKYIDAISSWWANPYGHCNDFINERITEQIGTLEHVLFGGFTHPWAVQLSEKLCKITGNHYHKVFYSDNGSTAIEVALKMALQYYYNIGRPRKKIVAFENAFHGDTFGAMAVSGLSLFTEAFKDQLIQVERIPLPEDPDLFEKAKSQLIELLDTNDVAAFIFEPIVQGAAGMRIYKGQYLDPLIELCQEYNTMTIADEVMTGFGRTGNKFASDVLNHKPDIMCLSKGLTAGYIPMAATLATSVIYEGFLSENVNHALFHGHTFMANPIGCATALAGIELLLSDTTYHQIAEISASHHVWIEKMKLSPVVRNANCLGVIAVIEFNVEKQEYYGILRNNLYQYYIEKGIILRPIGNRVYIMPPYCITPSELKKIYQTIEGSIDDVVYANRN